MGLLERFRARTKGVERAHPLIDQQQVKSWMRLGSTGKDWQKEQQDAWANGVVASVMCTILDKVSQSKPVGLSPDASKGVVIDGASTNAIDRVMRLTPVGEWSFWRILATSLKLFGMAYIVFDQETRTLTPFMETQVTRDPRAGELFYKVRTHGNSGKERTYKEEDVTVLQYGIPDPRNPLLYISPLLSCVREIVGENEVTNFMASVLYNMGMPGVIVSPRKSIATEMATKWVEKVKQSFATLTRDKRGGTLVAPEEIDVKTVSFAPNQMNLDALDRLFITKICSALGVDPMAVGLPSDNRTYNNYAESREALIEDCILPLWDVMLPPFEQALRKYQLLVGTPEAIKVAIDRSKYRELEDDKFKKAQDNRDNFKSGITTRGEARQALGLKSDTSDSRTFFDMMAESRGGAVRARWNAEERRKIEKLHEATS